VKISSTDLQKKIKIRPAKTELFHVDERTDMTKQTVAFRNFANARKNWVEGKSG
jgi:hypothetical protein